MINGQLLPQGILHKGLLAAIARTDRELFLPLNQRSIAYSDKDITITPSRSLLNVLTFARLMQVALDDIPNAQSILIIGEPSLYGATIAKQMGLKATLLEPEIDSLQRHGDEDISLHKGNLFGGCLPHAPYDIILMAGSVTGYGHLPPLTQQLTTNGVLVGIIKLTVSGTIFILRKKGTAVAVIPNVNAPSLPTSTSSSSFSFNS